MPISHIIFHAVLSMMHMLSYPALGHILIWRKLQPLDGLLKSGQDRKQRVGSRQDSSAF